MMNRVRLHPLDDSVDLREWCVRVLSIIFRDRPMALMAHPNDGTGIECLDDAPVFRTGWFSSVRYIRGQQASQELLDQISHSFLFQASLVWILNDADRSMDEIRHLWKFHLEEETVWASCDGWRLHWVNPDDQTLRQLSEFCQIEPDSYDNT